MNEWKGAVHEIKEIHLPEDWNDNEVIIHNSGSEVSLKTGSEKIVY